MDNLKKNEKMSIIVFLGIIIAVMGILASLFCILSINRDMTPHGLSGIKGDYKYPFTDYEKSQLSRLAASILTFITGTAMIFWGRKVKYYRPDSDTGNFDIFSGIIEVRNSIFDRLKVAFGGRSCTGLLPE